MQKLTAQFIESFYALKQENFLTSNFVEEVAMIEQLAGMNLIQDDEHYLRNFIFKEIPKLQSIISQTYSNDILPNSKLNKSETVEESLTYQTKLVKSNFKTFFVQVFDDEKFKIAANANLLSQRQQSFKPTSGIAPSLQTAIEDETFFKPIVMPTPQKLETLGQELLNENVGNWQANFKRKSETLLLDIDSKSTNKKITNVENKDGFELTPKIFSLIILVGFLILTVGYMFL